ncbi:hypothetical protein BH20ACT6_BH20ACT6_24430 [soil metagenome]
MAATAGPRRAALRTLLSTSTAGMLVVTGTGLPVAAAVTTAGRPDFEAPFACGQRWQAQTRAGHSPSYYAVDFNRDHDDRAPVSMSAPGRVSAVADLGGSSYGKYVVVDHRRGWSTLYAHLAARWVTEGQWLDQGQLIGLLGSSGSSTSAHLHYEQRLDRVQQHAVFHDRRLVYNSTIRSHNCGDVPIGGDWDDDRRDEVGVFRPRSDGAVFRLRQRGGDVTAVRFGGRLDRPVTGDWDGDGRTDLGVWKRTRQVFKLRIATGRTTVISFGGRRSLPVTGDWDGDGRTDVGAFSPRRRTFVLRLPGGAVRRVHFGSTGSVPVTGDWDGDGRDDLGTLAVRTAIWRLRSSSTGVVTTASFGRRNGLPVPGDWDGDGSDTLGGWHPGDAVFALQGASGTVRIPFGIGRG